MRSNDDVLDFEVFGFTKKTQRSKYYENEALFFPQIKNPLYSNPFLLMSPLILPESIRKSKVL